MRHDARHTTRSTRARRGWRASASLDAICTWEEKDWMAICVHGQQYPKVVEATYHLLLGGGGGAPTEKKLVTGPCCCRVRRKQARASPEARAVTEHARPGPVTPKAGREQWAQDKTGSDIQTAKGSGEAEHTGRLEVLEGGKGRDNEQRWSEDLKQRGWDTESKGTGKLIWTPRKPNLRSDKQGTRYACDTCNDSRDRKGGFQHLYSRRRREESPSRASPMQHAHT